MTVDESTTPSDEERAAETFSLRPLYHDDTSFEPWSSTSQGTLRICFCRERIASELVDDWTQDSVYCSQSADHEPVDLYFNERIVARGVLVTKEGRLGVKVTQIVNRDAA